MAPAAPLLVIAPYGVMVGSVTEYAGPAVVLILFYGYPLTLIFGLPIYWLMRAMGWLQWWQISFAGIVIGAIVPLSLLLSLVVLSDAAAKFSLVGEAMLLLAIGAGFGGVSGLAFWLLAKPSVSAASGQRGDSTDGGGSAPR